MPNDVGEHIQPCTVQGCEGLAWGAQPCDRCREEIDALEQWAYDRNVRSIGRKAALLRMAERVRGWWRRVYA